MAEFSPEEIGKIAELASLELTAAEKEAFAAQFEQILEYFRVIAQAPLAEGGQASAAGQEPHFREDEAVPSGVSPADFSTHLERGHFKVPKVIE